MQSERDLNNFHSRCEEVMTSRFILAETKIAELLKSVVLSPVLYRAVERCLNDFNYEVAFLKARAADPVSGGYRFSLPENRADLVAFVFCLLCEIESKKRDLQRLLEDCFSAGGNCVDGYAAFCKQIILPFEAALAAIAGEYDAGEGADPQPDGQKFFGTDFASLSASTLEEILALCGELSRLLGEERSFPAEEKQEMLFLIEAFCHALSTRDRKLIRALFVGMKNAFRGYKRFFDPLGEIERTLKEIWIV